MQERILYHGTADELVRGVLRNVEPLIGYRYPNDPGYSGTLTDNSETASLSAFKKAIWEVGRPIILYFRIPEDQCIDEGPIGDHPNNPHAFSTTLKVDADALPQAYLDGLSLTREEAARRIATGEMEFFQVPCIYVQEVKILKNPLEGLI